MLPTHQEITKHPDFMMANSTLAVLPSHKSIMEMLGLGPVKYKTPPENNPQQFISAIGQLETGGEKNPYSFKQPSGVKSIGDANGKYQITDTELKTYGSKFLGQDVTPKEFLTNPELQDKFMAAKTQHLLEDLKLPIEQAAVAHRAGYSNLDVLPEKIKEHQGYVDKFKELYYTKANE